MGTWEQRGKFKQSTKLNSTNMLKFPRVSPGKSITALPWHFTQTNRSYYELSLLAAQTNELQYFASWYWQNVQSEWKKIQTHKNLGSNLGHLPPAEDFKRNKKTTNFKGLASEFWCIIPIISLELPYIHLYHFPPASVALCLQRPREHKHGNNATRHFKLMWLTFCPFIPPVPSAPGWPCGRRPWLMTL